MNILTKLWCRTFQKGLFVAEAFLPWRKPQLLKPEGGVAGLWAHLEAHGLDCVLLVSDAMIVKLGLTDGLRRGLEKHNVKCVLYDKVVPNPTIDNIEEALSLYKAEGCNAIIAFGGGSAMDCAKGVGARVARPKKSVRAMKGLLKVRKRLPDLYAIPTTAGTGSETTLAAVITDSATHEKYPINDLSLIPRYAVLDASLTVGLPKKITAETGLDALTHAVEAYIGASNTADTRASAVEATQLIFKYLKRAYDVGVDIEAREGMQKAAFEAGVAFTRAYVGNVHAMAHTLGGFYGVPHGLANAVILPYILDFYGEKAYKKLAQLSDCVNLCAKEESDKVKAEKFIAEIRRMRLEMNIPDKIEGIKDEDIPTMSARAYSEANPLYPVPRIMSKEDFADMFRKIGA